MAKFKVETDYGAITTVIADYMEVGNRLTFKNRDSNTVVAAFYDWKQVVKEDDEPQPV